MTEVDLFVSTKRVKVLMANSQVWGPGLASGVWGDSTKGVSHPLQPTQPSLPVLLQEAMMDHALQTISYIADIGSVLVLMARRRVARRPAPQAHSRRLYKMICHVFHSEDVSSRVPSVLGERRAPALCQSPTLPHCHPSIPPSSPSCRPLSHIFWAFL